MDLSNISPRQSLTFGSMVRAIRNHKRIGFREMILRTGLDACDYSNMERGLMLAPASPAKLEAIVSALSLDPNHLMYWALLNLAKQSQAPWPPPLIEMSEREVAGKLPALISVLHMSEADLDVIVETVRYSHTSEFDREVN